LNNFDKIYGEYSHTPTDDLSKFWRSEVKGQGQVTLVQVPGDKGIRVETGASK